MILGILLSGGVSGGHLNPAVTVAVASMGKFKWAKVRSFNESRSFLGGELLTSQILY